MSIKIELDSNRELVGNVDIVTDPLPYNLRLEGLILRVTAKREAGFEMRSFEGLLPADAFEGVEVIRGAVHLRFKDTQRAIIRQQGDRLKFNVQCAAPMRLAMTIWGEQAPGIILLSH